MWQINFYEDLRGKSPVLDFINHISPRTGPRLTTFFACWKNSVPTWACRTPAGSKAGCGSFALATIACFTFST